MARICCLRSSAISGGLLWLILHFPREEMIYFPYSQRLIVT
jgi:hypothetical protein